jgi:hypothetical protein
VVGLHVRFRFYGELNDFLPPPRRNAEFEHPVGTTDTLKHIIESLGVPHTEVGAVAANGKRHDLSDPLAARGVTGIFRRRLERRVTLRECRTDSETGRTLMLSGALAVGSPV